MKYFKLEELVDKKTFEMMGDMCIDLFTPGALVMLDGIREFFGVPVTVNNWHTGGSFQFRGYRPQGCGVGAPGGEHYKGNAFDMDIHGMTAEQARKAIIEAQNHELLKNIMRIEDGVSWLHCDCKTVPNRIRIFKP